MMGKIYGNQKEGLVSIIIPSYNYGIYITDALDGLKEQSYKQMEVIVLDDCSTDNTREIVRNWQEEYEDNFEAFVYLKLPERLPPEWVINIGFIIASGEYIVIHDADDISKKDKIEKQIKWFEAHPETAVVGTKYQDFVENKERAIGYSLWILTDRLEIAKRYRETPYPSVCFGTIMFRRELLNTVLACKKPWNSYGDYDFIKRIIDSNYIIDNIDEYLFYVRNHARQCTKNKESFLNNFRTEVDTGNKVSVILPVQKNISGVEEFLFKIFREYSVSEVIIITDESIKSLDWFIYCYQDINNGNIFGNLVLLKIPGIIESPGLHLIALHFVKSKRVLLYSNEINKESFLLEANQKYAEKAGLDKIINVYNGGDY